jgi:hypothetical protein
MKYSVGQVIYVILKKEQRVYPMQIVEEITKKTLEGADTTYAVRGGNDPKSQLMISEIDGEIFDSAEKARSALTQRAVESINRLVDVAIQKAKEWYPGSFEAPSDDPLASLRKTNRPKTPRAPRRGSNEVEELAKELQHEADDAATFVTLPDGSKAKVRLPDSLS